MSSLTIIGGSNESQKSDGTITSGGNAQVLFGGSRPAYGFSIFNNHASEDLWFSDGVSTNAAIDGAGSVRIAPYQLYETPLHYRPNGPVTVIAATTGHKFTGRFW